jgi:hypothetical protein
VLIDMPAEQVHLESARCRNWKVQASRFFISDTYGMKKRKEFLHHFFLPKA